MLIIDNSVLTVVEPADHGGLGALSDLANYRGHNNNHCPATAYITDKFSINLVECVLTLIASLRATFMCVS